MPKKKKNVWQRVGRPVLALAPMAGYTDPAFRIMALKFGADVVYTEMVSVEAIWRKNKKTLAMLETLPGEKNVILQLFGSQLELFSKALNVINNLSCHPGESRDPEMSKNPGSRIKHGMTKIAGIDINLGCPAKKVYKTGAGAALMNNKKLAREIISTTLENTNLPVSIKIRSRVKNVSAVEFIKYIKDLPLTAVMIHGRSLKSGFSGPIDYKMIKEIKKLLPNIPVLANGGVNSAEDARIMLSKTGADGLGLARGVWGRPWLFAEIKKTLTPPSRLRGTPPLSKGRVSGSPLLTKEGVRGRLEWPQIKPIALQHAKYFLKYNSNLIPLRKHLIHYTKGLTNASDLRQKIIKVTNLKDLLNL